MAMNQKLLRPKASGDRYKSLRVSLVAYWPMNETATSGDVSAIDWTGRGNDLASNNSVLSTNGLFGNSRAFVTGNSEWLSRSANTDLQLGNNDWTLSFWINVTDFVNISAYVAKDASAAREFFILQISTGARPIRFSVFNSAGTEQTVDVGGVSSGQWTWVAMRHSGGVVTCRVNGASGTITRAGGAAWATQSTPWTVGRRDFSGFLGYITGRVDEMAKWNRALTNTELDTLYNNGNGIDLRT